MNGCSISFYCVCFNAKDQSVCEFFEPGPLRCKHMASYNDNSHHIPDCNCEEARLEETKKILKNLEKSISKK